MENIQTPEEGTEQEIVSPEEETLEENDNEGEVDNEPKEEFSPPLVDYKKKFSESAKENSILREQIQNLNRKIGSFTKEEVPTEAELKNHFPQWDEMGLLEKELAIKNIILERRLNGISLKVSQIEEDFKWNQELDKFLERNELTDSYPELKNREKEFRKFVSKPTHRGVSFDVLARAFLYGSSMKQEKPKEGSLVERGSGGEKVPQKPKKGYTPEELALLRAKDPKKYREVVEKGLIDIEEF